MRVELSPRAALHQLHDVRPNRFDLDALDVLVCNAESLGVEPDSFAQRQRQKRDTGQHRGAFVPWRTVVRVDSMLLLAVRECSG
jgi:hypothetical protein